MLDLLSPRRRQTVIQALQREPNRRVTKTSHSVKMLFWLHHPLLTGERIGYHARFQQQSFGGHAQTVSDAVQYIEAEVSRRRYRSSA